MIVNHSHTALETPKGPMRTYLYEPVAQDRPVSTYPGLILYSEIFQHTDLIRRLAVQFASHGYIVMVPEIYHSDLPLGPEPPKNQWAFGYGGILPWGGHLALRCAFQQKIQVARAFLPRTFTPAP